MKYFLLMMFMAMPVIATPAMAQSYGYNPENDPVYSVYNGVDEGQLANERMVFRISGKMPQTHFARD